MENQYKPSAIETLGKIYGTVVEKIVKEGRKLEEATTKYFLKIIGKSKINAPIVQTTERTNNISDLEQAVQQTVEQTGPDQNQKTAEERLKQYLECEELLGTFFVKVNYCGTQCTNLETGKYPIRSPLFPKEWYAPGNIGCCLNDMHGQHSDKISDADLKLLTQRRIEKYGLPENKEEGLPLFGKPCRYHTREGCILKDHKGPVCVAYLCDSQIKHLKDKFGIDYDMKKAFITLEDILSGKVSEEQVSKFKSEVADFIKIIISTEKKAD